MLDGETSEVPPVVVSLRLGGIREQPHHELLSADGQTETIVNAGPRIETSTPCPASPRVVKDARPRSRHRFGERGGKLLQPCKPRRPQP
ncbi:hypothetical protein Ct61P_08104 [Colletotrichum tofieldiae]|nr:hypothetical protein Ct61P_08104 [Colletotrichum tofieldiae]